MDTARALIKSGGFKKMPSPKFREPVFREADSGLRVTGCIRSAAVIPTAPPVDT